MLVPVSRSSVKPTALCVTVPVAPDKKGFWPLQRHGNGEG